MEDFFYEDHSTTASRALNKMEENKQENLRQLIAVRMEKLIELKKYYSNWAREAGEDGYKESGTVNYERCCQVAEAIQIKRGNDEEVWDCLT